MLGRGGNFIVPLRLYKIPLILFYWIINYLLYPIRNLLSNMRAIVGILSPRIYIGIIYDSPGRTSL